MAGRPLRVCDLCGQVDDHPRHVFAALPGTEFEAADQGLIDRLVADDSIPRAALVDAVASLRDTTVQIAHMDCCAASGRCDGSCQVALKAAGGNGATLVQHLEAEARRLDEQREG
jgi:hypothetical protein